MSDQQEAILLTADIHNIGGKNDKCINEIKDSCNGTGENKNDGFIKYVLSELIKLLAPFVPHIAEEFNEMFGNKTSVFLCSFPVCDEKKLVKDETEIAVQINSKVRARIIVPTGSTDKEIEKTTLADENVIAALEGRPVKKVIVIKGRLVNLVV